ncbi:nicotinate (nicotinamide) nucleotide adenylyltransferase [Helicobacter sp. 11S02596-1]|uniref:nicotinate (nicotinamide) nucleotide adenylyltransferase n=1 Tax=Helicobacter sp. 11S02596-1 TaxID=1476194 RepID=UPI000BA5159F|nr:nicotinate (nicotinamide) nucleotide adenylyltransferase [Helicobacter sp. 11S02596-1]PAF44274.1 hypothetical protein BJI48_03605 [Helicobacter sp. 11S02596-1]
MNIAIYGGSFDPPHIAHFQIIQTILATLHIDKLIVIVAYQNPFKKPCLFSAKERYEWMKQLGKNFPNVEVSDMEIVQKKPIASIQSVLDVKKTFHPEKIFFIIGADNLSSLHKWHRYDELKELVTFVIIEREGYEVQNQDFQKIALPSIKHEISSSQIRKHLSTCLFPDDLPEKIKTEVIQSYYQITKTTQGVPLTPNHIENRIQKIASLLDEKKAQDIETFDLRGRDYIVDYVMIATSLAGKHSYSLLDMLKTELKPLGEVFYSTDEESEDWLIADLGDIMIHIFTENHRKKFNLEEFLTQIQKQKSI